MDSEINYLQRHNAHVVLIKRNCISVTRHSVYVRS